MYHTGEGVKRDSGINNSENDITVALARLDDYSLQHQFGLVMMKCTPYLLSDGVDGVLLSHKGKCIIPMAKLEEIRSRLNTFKLIWIDQEQATLRGLPELGRKRTQKCLDALSNEQNYICHIRLRQNDDEQTFLCCSTAKEKLHACLQKLNRCRIKSIVPLEAFLWASSHDSKLITLTWKEVFYTVYSALNGSQLVKSKLCGNDIESLLVGSRSSKVVDLLQDEIEIPKVTINSYQVKRIDEIDRVLGLKWSLALASCLLFFGAIAMHFREIVLEHELRRQKILYEEQVFTQKEYNQGLKSYKELHESISLLEQIAISSYRANQVNYLIQSMSLEGMKSLEYSVESSQVTVNYSLKSSSSKFSSVIVRKAETAVGVLGSSYCLDMLDEASGLKIQSREIHN